jgi:3-oxoadipate enol-lactonase
MKVMANGILVEYDLTGPEDRPVVTLSHSLATSSAMWEPQADVLARSYRLLTYDTRGHGGSEVPPGPYSLGDLVADVRGLLAALAIRKTYFAGLSMGGMIGQAFALTHPELLHGLVLCSTNARMTPDAAAVWEERITVTREQGMEAHVEPTIRRWFTPGFVERRPDVVDRVRDLIRHTDPTGYIGCIEAIRHTDFLEQLSQLRMPVLVMEGKDDPGLPQAEAICGSIPGSEFVVLSPGAHLCNLEQPAAFSEALTRFLDNSERTRSDV